MKSIHKILLITDNHSLVGGTEKYFFTLKKALEQYPELAVTCLSFGPEEKTTENFILLKETPSTIWRFCWRLLFNPIKYWQIKRVLKKINPDVIHLHNVKKYTISLLKAVRGYRVIQTVHDYSLICPTSWNLHRDLQPCSTGLTPACVWEHKRNINSLIYLYRLLAFTRLKTLIKKVVEQFIAPSPLLQQYLEKNHFQPCTYLPPMRQENKSIEFTSMRPQHFLYVGQLGKHKGVATLIEEFAIAHQTNSQLTLSLAGLGKEENYLRQRVKELHLEKNIHFLGWSNPENLYASAMALIFPSIGLESFGLVLTEAMQHGRAIIGSNRGPTAWLVDDEKTGLLFDPLKKGDLAKKILLLADNPALAEQYGRQAFAKCNTLMSNEEVIQQMIDIYKTPLAIKS